MKILIVHLSDVHLTPTQNFILSNTKPLVASFQNIECDELFLVITGDITFSGLDIEYSQAIILLKEIGNNIKSYSGKNIHFILVPGNHDCNLRMKDSNRDSFINDILSKNNKFISKEIIKQCCGVQKNYFDFSNANRSGKVIFSDYLLNILEFSFLNYNIIFNCYNTAWLSHIGETETYFPIETIERSLFPQKADIIVSVLHHSYNWFRYQNHREFQRHVEYTSHIILTGHEHISSKSQKSDLEGNYVVTVDGSILQHHINSKHSANREPNGFNIIYLDLGNSKFRIHNFFWKSDFFSCPNTPESQDLKRSATLKKSEFSISDNFLHKLNDLDAKHTHPSAEEINLDDIFVFPYLRDLKLSKRKGGDILNDVIDSKKLLELTEPENRMLLIGCEKSGKTSLCNYLFKNYFEKGLIPVKIDGFEIKSPQINDFNDTLSRCFINQYSQDALEKYLQLEKTKIIIIIDDFHRSKLNLLYKGIILRRISSLYPNILITVSDLFHFEELYAKDEENRHIFESYHKYAIRRFGNLLRSKLIEKWNLIGAQNTIEEDELLQKNDKTKKIVDAIVGKSLVPCYPFYLLLILEALESQRPHNLQESSYSYYYDMLIIKSLNKIEIKKEEIGAYYSYIAELANLFFENRTHELSPDKIKEFNRGYYDRFGDVDPERDKYVEKLHNASILESDRSIMKFRFKYIYYYFLAKYMAKRIADVEIKERISKMTKRLHIEEFAMTIMFLTHLSSDPFIINEIIESAKKIFVGLIPIKFENDITPINNLINQIPKLVLTDKSAKETREEKYKKEDEKEERLGEKLPEDEFNLDEKIDYNDPIYNFNLGIKSIEVMGQILKNHYGSLEMPKKVELGEEAYNTGLRSLRSIFDFIITNPDIAVDTIKQILKRDKVREHLEIEAESRRILFVICYVFSYFFIERIAFSMGSEHLSETLKQIHKRNDIVSYRLIDVAIKLSIFNKFPYKEIEELLKGIKNKHLPYTILRKMVVDYLYMFPVEYMERQKICGKLGITLETQKKIDRLTALERGR